MTESITPPTEYQFNLTAINGKISNDQIRSEATKWGTWVASINARNFLIAKGLNTLTDKTVDEFLTPALLKLWNGTVNQLREDVAVTRRQVEMFQKSARREFDARMAAFVKEAEPA